MFPIPKYLRNQGPTPSLTTMTQTHIFKDLSDQITTLTKQSIFAIGGTIPITSLPDMAICESDEVYSDSQSTDGKEMAVDRGEPLEPKIEVLGVQTGSFYGSGESSTDKNLNDPSTHKMRCDPVVLRWDSTRDGGSTQTLELPHDMSSYPAFQQLLSDCQPASFGRGGVDVMDESYRKAGKIDERDFCTNFDPYAVGIVDAVAHVLMPEEGRVSNQSRGLRAELYKLNVYSAPSGKFKAHVDTPRSKHQVGSLVVCLPSVHKGGQLVLRHEGREVVFDRSGEKGREAIQWAAFYSDCEHEVLEVTEGHRLTLTYNLYATCRANAAYVDPKDLGVHKLLTRLIKEPAFCKNGLTLGYHCSHAYPHTEKSTIETLPTTLKGVDKLVYECFVATGLETGLRQVLKYDLDVWDNGLGNAMRKLTYKPSDASEARWNGLRDLFTDEQDKRDKRFIRKDSEGGWSDEGCWNEEGEVVVLSNNLVKLSATEVGMDDGYDDSDVIEAWTEDFRVQRVNWLNEKSQEQMALVHGTYGNNAGIGTKYCSLVITLQIPPLQDR